MADTRRELMSSRHEVEIALTTVGDRGKFENLNRLLDECPADGHDWLLAVDDDVALPSGFLDEFLFLAERFGLTLARRHTDGVPTQRGRSRGVGPAWSCTRRHLWRSGR